jgi:HPt (histidine-containing phosphotransfer) domain-containing protein
MPVLPPPNPRLAALVAMLGEADTRELLELFLASIPELLGKLSSPDRSEAERAAHSLKSSAKQMGMLDLAQRMAAMEIRLRSDGPAVPAAELAEITRDVAAAAQPLRDYAAQVSSG